MLEWKMQVKYFCGSRANPLHCLFRCDDGYHGDACLPNYSLPHGMDAKFEDFGTLTESGWRIVGGSSSYDVISTCGAMTSSSYLLFSEVTVLLLARFMTSYYVFRFRTPRVNW